MDRNTEHNMEATISALFRCLNIILFLDHNQIGLSFQAVHQIIYFLGKKANHPNTSNIHQMILSVHNAVCHLQTFQFILYAFLHLNAILNMMDRFPVISIVYAVIQYFQLCQHYPADILIRLN